MLQWNRQSDTFPSSLSAQWVRRNGSTDPQVISGLLTASTAGGFFPAEFIARPAVTADQYASVIVGSLAAGTVGAPSAIVLRTPNSATSGTVPLLFINNQQLGIYTMTSWAAAGLTARAAFASSNGGSNVPVGSHIEFFVLGNTYYGVCNGVVIVSWPDTTAIASQTGRYGAAIMQYASDGGSNGVMGFDNFQFGDFRPRDVPMRMQAVSRSSTY